MQQKIFFGICTIILISIIGCNDITMTDNIEDNITQSVSNPHNAGTAHNASVYYLDTCGALYWDGSNMDDYINNNAPLVESFCNASYSWGLSTTQTERDSIIVNMNKLMSSPNIVWQDFRNRSIITSNISSAELTIIDSAYSVLFNTDYSNMTRVQASEYIKNQADTLIARYNNILWDTSPVSGELAAGVIYIMKSSSEYWGLDTGLSGGTPVANIVRVDAFGYLCAWTMAIYSEWTSTGRLDINNQWTRIGYGVSGATMASFGKRFNLT